MFSFDTIIIKNNNILKSTDIINRHFRDDTLTFTLGIPSAKRKVQLLVLLIEPFYCLTQNSIKNLRLIINILIKNSYPPQLVFNTILNRLLIFFNKDSRINILNNTVQTRIPILKNLISSLFLMLTIFLSGLGECWGVILQHLS